MFSANRCPVVIRKGEAKVGLSVITVSGKGNRRECQEKSTSSIHVHVYRVMKGAQQHPSSFHARPAMDGDTHLIKF